MTTSTASRATAALLSLAVLVPPPAAHAQVTDVPRPITSVTGSVQAATQIGRRLFIGGFFASIGQTTRRLLLVDGSGANPSALPDVNGAIVRAVSDGVGGVVVFGDFTRVGTLPQEHFAHFRADGTLDAALRVTADGEIGDAIVAHGRIYVAGNFTSINGAARAGFAALDATSGQVLSWGAAVRTPAGYGARLAVSSTAVYVRTVDGQLWGLDAGSGAVRFRRTLYTIALAATSQRVFVGTSTSQGARIVALDPLTGEDDPSWTMPFGFRFLPASYGSDATYFTLTIDGGRLLIAGRFDPDDGSFDSFAAIDIASATRLPWSGVNGEPIQTLAVLGDVIVLSFSFSGELQLRSRTTGAPIPFAAPMKGGVSAMVPTARGVVVTGSLSLSAGTPGGAVASIDLDSGALVANAARDIPRFSSVQNLATDGTWLFATVQIDGMPQFHKIDTASGASVATLPAPAGSNTAGMQLVGDRLFVWANSATGSSLWAIDVAAWSLAPLGLSLDGPVDAIGGAGGRAYLAGRFTTINGAPRRGLAAVDRVTGALLPWDPQADGYAYSVVSDGPRVWVSGEFQHVGGQARRGLAQLDASTAQATAWDPDAPTGNRATGGYQTVAQLVRAADGTLLARVSGSAASVSGQVVDGFVAFAPDGSRLSWGLVNSGLFAPNQLAATRDCVVTLSQDVGCLAMGIAPPAALSVTQAGAATTLTWAAAVGQMVTGWRLEVGTSELRSDVLVLDLPGSQTSITAPLPPGGWVARVRAITAAGISMATSDVSFAMGRAAAPLDLTARVTAHTATLQWTPPTTGAPAAYYLDLGRSRGAGGSGRFVAGNATSLTLDLAPGEYWGRLYALSAPTDTLGSRPSAEVRIDVDVTQLRCNVPPSPPVNLRATTAPGAVQLLWDLAPGEQLPSNWRLTAGTAPGASDLGRLVVPGVDLGLTGTVSRGTYYVRVSAFSWCGEGPQSAELRVDVP